MAKRRNENGQMRREEYEAADDDVSADLFEIGFQRASEDSIRKRKIVKARVGGRATAKPKAATAAAAGGDDAAKSNPFGGFQGLTAAKPAASANPFAGFSGLTGNAKPVTEKTGVTTSGSTAATTSGSFQQAMEALNKGFLAFVNGQSQKNPSASWVAAVQDYLKYAAEISTKHAATKPVAINEPKRAAPAPFSFGSTPASTTAAFPAPAASSSSFSFGAAKKTEEPAKSPASSGFSFGGAAKKVDEPTKSPAKPAAPAFSFGGAAKKDDESAKSPAKPAAGGFSFGGGSSSLFSAKSSDSDEKVTPAFSFGAPLSKPAPPAASTPATSGFSFGNLSAPKSATPATSGFSFGASAPATLTSASTTAAADEDEENIGREEATVIIKADSPDDDCTFEADKAKIFEFKKDEKRWADKGVHPLKVLVSTDKKSARILVRNEIGKVVLNSALYKGMAVRPQEAKGKKTGVTLALQVDGGELTQFLLKVNAARVDEFIKALEAAAGSC
ncbi:Ran-binding protein RANBP3 [Phytophthora cinnamomi]|uniref:Ran-binding protein RANBP3 n=1 Tax=Phytophthora cinnamomi TaxID=4785 RepID=UPI0035597A74|nr:Ran-binding protein RANBP3 [Phytophthora cinnamomi]